MEYSVPGIVNTHPNTVSGLKSSSDKVLKTDTSYNPFSLFFETVVVWPRLFPELKYFKVYINFISPLIIFLHLLRSIKYFWPNGRLIPKHLHSICWCCSPWELHFRFREDSGSSTREVDKIRVRFSVEKLDLMCRSWNKTTQL